MMDLENRTRQFAIEVRRFAKLLIKNIILAEDLKHLIRSSGSIGANYLKANDALSKKDFLMRLKISRKEAKETEYWLRIIIESHHMGSQETALCEKLIRESSEFRKILSVIIQKSIQ